MKRRDFIKRAVPLTAVPLVLNGFRINAYGRNPVLEALTAAAIDTDRVLVVIQLFGGNDGLNMVIPLDQYAARNTMIGMSAPAATGKGRAPGSLTKESLAPRTNATASQRRTTTPTTSFTVLPSSAFAEAIMILASFP